MQSSMSWPFGLCGVRAELYISAVQGVGGWGCALRAAIYIWAVVRERKSGVCATIDFETLGERDTFRWFWCPSLNVWFRLLPSHSWVRTAKHVAAFTGSLLWIKSQQTVAHISFYLTWVLKSVLWVSYVFCSTYFYSVSVFCPFAGTLDETSLYSLPYRNIRRLRLHYTLYHVAATHPAAISLIHYGGESITKNEFLNGEYLPPDHLID